MTRTRRVGNWENDIVTTDKIMPVCTIHRQGAGWIITSGPDDRREEHQASHRVKTAVDVLLYVNRDEHKQFSVVFDACSIGEALRDIRKHRGLSQIAAAKQIGVSVQYVAMLEQGGKPAQKTADKINAWINKTV